MVGVSRQSNGLKKIYGMVLVTSPVIVWIMYLRFTKEIILLRRSEQVLMHWCSIIKNIQRKITNQNKGCFQISLSIITYPEFLE